MRYARLFLLLVVSALLLGSGGSSYRWERAIDAQHGWSILELPDDVLAAGRSGLADLRVVSGEDEVSYAFESSLAPAIDSLGLRDVESTVGRETTALVDRGAHPSLAGSMQINVLGSEPFLKPLIVEASDDRTTWREFARGSIFRSGHVEKATLRFAPNDRRYWRLRLDDRNGDSIRPESVVVARSVDAAPARSLPLGLAAATADSAEMTRYFATLPFDHAPLTAIRVNARDAAFERRLRVYERVLFRDELSRRLVGEATIYRSADGHESSAIAVGDVSSRTLEIEIANGGSRPLDVAEVRALVQPRRIVFFAAETSKLALRYGSDATAAPRYDLDVALAKGRPLSLREARLGPVVDHGVAPAQPQPERRGPPVEAASWRGHRPIQLPASGTIAYLDLGAADAPAVRIVDADGRQVPYVFEHNERRVRRPADLLVLEHGRATEVTVNGFVPGERVDALELTASAPDYFERGVVISTETTDARGPTGRRQIGAATWSKRPSEPFAPLRLSFYSPPAPPLLVTIDNGDNGPLVLGPSVIEIALQRIDFVFGAGDRLTLLTGNESAAVPRYDLALLAPALLASPAEPATLGVPMPSTPLPAKVPRWFWVAATAGGALLLLVLVRALKMDPGSEDTRDV